MHEDSRQTYHLYKEITYPDVPTALETGIDYFKSDDTRAYYAPPGTDDAVIQYLAEKIKEVSENEECRVV